MIARRLSDKWARGEPIVIKNFAIEKINQLINQLINQSINHSSRPPVIFHGLFFPVQMLTVIGMAQCKAVEI